MQIEEFSKRTGFYPDSTLYNVIQREYERQDDKGNDIWWDKDEFCAAYREDRDGLAEKCQREADQEIWRTDERYRKAQTESANRIADMYNEIQHLHEELGKLKAENQRLKEDDETACRTLREMKCDKIKADMFCVLEQYVRDDVDPSDIGRAVVAYVDLLDWSALYK